MVPTTWSSSVNLVADIPEYKTFPNTSCDAFLSVQLRCSQPILVYAMGVEQASEPE